MKFVETRTALPGETLRERIDFTAILDQAISSLSFMEGFSNVRFKSNVSVTKNFYNDKKLITPIVQHLIHNAIRYRKDNIPDACVKIAMEDDPDGVKITVSDNGVGIGGNVQEAIDKMFARVTEKIPGHGLGLFTVNHCIRKLDGRITLESKESVGTTVMVWVRNEGNGG